MLLRIAGAALVATLVGPLAAQAHPPYEGNPHVLKTSHGNVEVVKSYVDGILGTDPAKIVVRTNGTIRAETEYHRDTSLACGWGRCFVAAADSPFALVPEHMWLLDGASLRRLDSFGARLLGVPVHLWYHLLGYGIALLFLVVPIIAIRQGTQIGKRESRAAGCFAALVAVGALGILVLWLYVVLVLSELSMTWALLLGACLFVGARALNAWRDKRILFAAPSH